MAIYIKIDVVPETIKEFFEYFYSYNNSYVAFGFDTYFDKEFKQLQCSGGKYRSFDDLLELAQTYYKDATETDVMKALLDVEIYSTEHKKNFIPLLSTCIDMKKTRYIPYTYTCDDYFNDKMELSKYTWAELLAPLNITNLKELDDYLNNKTINK